MRKIAAELPAGLATASLTAIFFDWRVWALALADFLRAMINNVLNFWMPTLVQDLGIPKKAYLEVGADHAPSRGAWPRVLMIWSRAVPTARGERRWHATVSILVSAVGLAAARLRGHAPVVSVLALTLIATGAMAWLAIFWTLPSAFLSGVGRGGRDRLDQRAVAARRLRRARHARAIRAGQRRRQLARFPDPGAAPYARRGFDVLRVDRACSGLRNRTRLTMLMLPKGERHG